MRRTALILLLMLICRISAAEDLQQGSAGRFAFGVEWGISGNYFKYNISTFITDVQSLVQVRSIDPFFHINGEIMALAGINLGKRFNISLGVGYAGIQKNMRFFPIEIRGQVFLKPGQSSGSYFQVGGGGGISENKGHGTAFFGRCGYGYRFYLGNGLSMDIKAIVQAALSHPDVYDKYTGKIVTAPNLRQSDSMSLNSLVSVALIF